MQCVCLAAYVESKEWVDRADIEKKMELLFPLQALKFMSY